MVGVKRVTPNSNEIYRLGPDVAKMKLTESPAAAYDPLSVFDFLICGLCPINHAQPGRHGLGI